MRKITLSLMAFLTAALISWGFAPAQALAQSRAPEFVLVKLHSTSLLAAQNGCQVKAEKLTLEDIMKLASSQCLQVRSVAIYSLGEIRDERAVNMLINLLQDPDCHIRRIAVRALGKIGDKRAVTPLVAVLSKQGENLSVRRTAAWALGQMSDPRACPALEIAACADDVPLSNASREAVNKLEGSRTNLTSSNL
ncbi:MAG: HEAT repeat domain-containing protein [Deltaproteobacteria bacterium]|nr:HEAT repeat domain-containing protein [Deltaproteobacteria bacterium]